jgi:hypothetical protein
MKSNNAYTHFVRPKRFRRLRAYAAFDVTAYVDAVDDDNVAEGHQQRSRCFALRSSRRIFCYLPIHRLRSQRLLPRRYIIIITLTDV